MKSYKSAVAPIVVLLACSSLLNTRSADAFLVKQNVVAMIPPRHQYQPNASSTHRHRISKRFPRGGGLHEPRQSNAAEKFKMVPAGISFLDNAPFHQSSLIFLGANALGFVISLLTGSHLHLDLLGTGAFAAAALPTLLSSTCTRISLSSAAVFTWGAKLASFLFFRALKVKTDGRLDDTLSTVGGTCKIFISNLKLSDCDASYTYYTRPQI